MSSANSADARLSKKGARKSNQGPSKAASAPGTSAIAATEEGAASGGPSASSGTQKSKAQLKAERRAVQEAQKAAMEVEKQQLPQKSDVCKPDAVEEKPKQQQKDSQGGSNLEVSKTSSKEEKPKQQVPPSNESKTKAKNKSKKPKASASVGKNQNEEDQQKEDSLHSEKQMQGEAGKPVETAKEVEQQNPPQSSGGDDLAADAAAGGANKSKAQLRAERRAVQEAQRAAKAAGKQQPAKSDEKQQNSAGSEPASNETKKGGQPKPKQPCAEVGNQPIQMEASSTETKKVDKSQGKQQKPLAGEIKQPSTGGGANKKKAVVAAPLGPPLPSFFRHLETPTAADQLTSGLFNENFADSQVEASFVQLSLMVAHDQLQGPTARCLGMARALRQLLGHVPAQDLPRLLKHKLDPNMQLLRSAKPLTVMEAYLEQYLAACVQECCSDDKSEVRLLDRLDEFVEEQIEKARSTMKTNLFSKINSGNTIMLYKPSSLIFECLEKIFSDLSDVEIILLDSPPNWEGQSFLRRLRAHANLSACPVRYALLSAAPSLLSDASKVVLEGHALTANGNVLAPVGTAYLANVAWSHRIPCLMLCHACQTWDKVLIDSVSYNELGRVSGDSQLCNIQYDLTPGDLVTALITERGILPCTGSPILPH